MDVEIEVNNKGIWLSQQSDEANHVDEILISDPKEAERIANRLIEWVASVEYSTGEASRSSIQL